MTEFPPPRRTSESVRSDEDLAPAIIVFDAMCVLCSGNAQLVLKCDYKKRFRLSSMQSATGQSLYRRFGIDPLNPDTLILVEGDRAIRDSDAVLQIYARLSGWPRAAAAVAKIVPRFLRDPVYRWVARNRYRLFGHRETCWLPSSAYADRIL